MPTWLAVTIGAVLGGGLLLVALIVLLPRILGGALKRAATGMFEAKAAALKGAAVSLAGTRLVDGPPAEYRDEDDPEEPREEGRWVEITATVTPAESKDSPFQLWEPEEIVACPARRDGKTYTLEDLDDALPSYVERAGGYDPEEDPDKLEGPLEIRVTAFAPNSVHTIQLMYYSVALGEPVELPS